MPGVFGWAMFGKIPEGPERPEVPVNGKYYDLGIGAVARRYMS